MVIKFENQKPIEYSQLRHRVLAQAKEQKIQASVVTSVPVLSNEETVLLNTISKDIAKDKKEEPVIITKDKKEEVATIFGKPKSSKK